MRYHESAMRWCSSITFLLCLLASCARICAQGFQESPQILLLTHQTIAPGKEAAFVLASTQRSHFLSTVKWPTVRLALRALTGPNELLFITGYNSLADWGHDREALERSPEQKVKLDSITTTADQFVVQRRDISAEFQKDISYRTNYDWSKMRYLDVITILLRPGRGDEYLQNRKIVLAAHIKAAVDEHMFIYQVSSGYPDTTFLVIRPVETFEGLDLEKRHGDHYLQVLGQEDRAKLHELFAASVQSQEEEFYAVDPVMSYVTVSWAGAEKSFWFPSGN